MSLRLLTALNPEALRQPGFVVGPTGIRCALDAATAALLTQGSGDAPGSADFVAALCAALPLPQALATLEQLRRTLALCRTLWEGNDLLARALPTGPDFSLSAPPPSPFPRLSRFTLLRADAGALSMESPLAHARIRLHDPRLLIAVSLLAAGASAADLVRPLGSEELASAFLGLLAAAAMLETGAASSPLDSWAFHDLLFHSRTRSGRFTSPYGALPHPRTPSPPSPAPLNHSAPALPLPRPPAYTPALPPLDAVLARRRSQPHHGPLAISRQQLGEFFFLCAHRRPFPSAGAIYELEIYAAVDRCRDLDPGLYHYLPLEHALAPVSGPGPDLTRLMQAAGRAARAAVPQTLLLLAARFEEVSTRYGSIAYALILKDAGVLLQTMY
ncbi:MAG: SagB family peptide dehydrogenase, partial [Terriglobales bacterium]